MKKNVAVNVTGIHSRLGEPTEKVETFSEGLYEVLEDGRHIIEYEEHQSQGDAPVRTRVTIDHDTKGMEIAREGAGSSTLKFRENLEYKTEYVTPYGSMLMKVCTEKFDFSKRNNEDIHIMVEYSLELEGQVLSSSAIMMEIKNAEAG
ncbi:MAG: DUF1934 domain-containing protein [Butyrivibrio sp.]|nr:DUF1934 domain-containing protein [Butyrivibrio sp.]